MYGLVQPTNEVFQPKRVKIDGIERQRRINNIQDQISDLSTCTGKIAFINGTR